MTFISFPSKSAFVYSFSHLFFVTLSDTQNHFSTIQFS
eukprot:UN01422